MSMRRPLTESRTRSTGTPVSRTTARRLAAGVVVTGLALSVSACGTGQKWVEQGLSPSGNGVYTTVGPIQAQNLTLVQGPTGSSSATLVGNLLNQGTAPDQLVKATLSPDGGQPSTAVITKDAVELLPTRLVNVGYNAESKVSFFNAPVGTSTYVPVTLEFKDAGTTTVNVLVVPAAGIYEGITPGPQPR